MIFAAAVLGESSPAGTLDEGDYSRWFRDAIKDLDLAAEIADVEEGASLSAPESRARIKELVERRYTAPANCECGFHDANFSPTGIWCLFHT
jgi:hypothetical protein